MEINYLQEFVELAKTCRFQETAEKLYISQSTLSKHIHAIEKELGADLFTRSTRKVELSETGRTFLTYAEQIVNLQQDYTEELTKSDCSKIVRVGTDANISLRQVERYLSNYIEEHPCVSVRLYDLDKAALRDKLRNGELDAIMAVRDLSYSDSEFASWPYYDDELTAVMSDKNPLYTQHSVTIDELRSYPIVANRTNFAKYLDPTLTDIKYYAERESFIIQVLNVSDSIYVCPSNLARHMTVNNDLSRKLKTLSIVPQSTIHVDIIYLRSRQNTPFIQSLLTQVKGDEEVYGI